MALLAVQVAITFLFKVHTSHPLPLLLTHLVLSNLHDAATIQPEALHLYLRHICT